jgi:hypothetical protein
MRMNGRAIVAVLLASLLLVGVACGSDDSKDDAASNAPTGTPAPPDPAMLAQQAADAIEAVKSFHFLVEHENGGTPIVLNLLMTRAEGDIVKPDRLRADVEAKASQLGNANVKVKVVNVGDEAQVTNPFNARDWVTLPGQNRLADIFDPGAGTTAALRSAKDLKITGEETLNGVKVWRMEGMVDAAELSAVASTIAEPGYTAKGTVWIGQATPLVHRVRLEGPLGSKDPQNIVRTIDLSKFDENVTIDLPSS